MAENKKSVTEEVVSTPLAGERIGTKVLTVTEKKGTIAEEGKDTITYNRYELKVQYTDPETGAFRTTWAKDNNGNNYEVPLEKNISVPKDIMDSAVKALGGSSE